MLLKTLTVKYPFSEFIVTGLKDVENRVTNFSYRGIILIHTSKSQNERWIEDCNLEAFHAGNKHLHKKNLSSQGHHKPSLGHIVGAVVIIDSQVNYNSPWAVYGYHHLILDSPIMFNTPIPAKGKLGLWVPQKEVIDQIAETDYKTIQDLYAFSKKELGIKYFI